MAKMTKRESDVMEIFWNHPGEHLSASDIMNYSDGLSIYTIQQILRRLLENNMVVVSGVSTNKKALIRMYSPVYSRAEYISGSVDMKTMEALAMHFVSDVDDEQMLERIKQKIEQRQKELKGQ